jgi:hypothetical protein
LVFGNEPFLIGLLNGKLPKMILHHFFYLPIGLKKLAASFSSASHNSLPFIASYPPLKIMSGLAKRQGVELILHSMLAQSCFNKVGHLRVCKQSKRGWEPQIFFKYFVTSQLYDSEICILVMSQLYHQKNKL